MYKKILNINSQAAGGLNKAENATSTITLQDLKTPSTMPSGNVNDENAPSNLETDAVANCCDEVICDNSFDRPLATIRTSPSRHVSSRSPSPPLSKMETDEVLENNTFLTHKSIHHIATHYDTVDENLENKQQNAWRPW